MFRPLLVHLQILWENRSKSYPYFNAFGIPQCIEIDSTWICFPRGSEDDLIKFEKCRPDDISCIVYKIMCCFID